MRSPGPLLVHLQRLIESSYDWKTGIEDVGPFVIGDIGYRHLYGDKEILEDPMEDSPGPRTLISYHEGRTRLGIYYPDHLVDFLEQQNPLDEVNEENVAPFSVVIEELDHFLMIAWCIRIGRAVRLVELEFHANITKYLVLAHFIGRLTRRPRLTPTERRWLRIQLFEGAGDGLPERFELRYRTAARLAGLFLDRIEVLPPVHRVMALRRFARHSWLCQRSCLESLDPAERLGLLLRI